MTIALPAHVEAALFSEAQRLGTTPDALAAKIIQEQLPPSKDNSQGNSVTGEGVETVWHRWRKHIEAIEADSTPRTGPTNLSQDTGRRFAELLEEQRRQGRL